MPKILIAEDVEMNIELLVQLLEDEAELVIAIDGQQAVEKAQAERPDLILMDMSMPVMDGWEATRTIRTMPELEGVIIVGLSAHAMDGHEEQALAAGCDHYLTKPLNDDLLFNLLGRYF